MSVFNKFPVIEAAYNKRHSSESTAFLRKQSNFIKHCALKSLENGLKKLEIEALELSLREREVSLAFDLKKEQEVSWTGEYGFVKRFGNIIYPAF